MRLTKDEREETARENMNLVRYVVNRYDNYEHLKDELFSAGLIGLAKAVGSYDDEKGYEFSTFAHHCITNEVNMHLRSENRPIRRMTNHQDFHSYSSETASTYQDEEYHLHTFVTNEDILEQIITQETYEEVMELMKGLPKDGTQILEGMFGINRDHPLNQSEQADEMGTTQANISKKRNKYMDMLHDRCMHISYDIET